MYDFSARRILRPSFFLTLDFVHAYPHFDVMRLKFITLKKCMMCAINCGAAVRGALHLGHFREDGMELNVAKEPQV